MLLFSKATDESQRNVFDKSRMRRDVSGALVSIHQGALPSGIFIASRQKKRVYGEFLGTKS